MPTHPALYRGIRLKMSKPSFNLQTMLIHSASLRRSGKIAEAI